MAGNTPKQSFPQPFEAEGDIYPYGATGPMARSPTPSYRTSGYPDYVSQYQTTPLANPAAVRAYTRNAPYMEEFMTDPRSMLKEMYKLQEAIKSDPNDVVSQYRARVLRQALGDVFGMQAPETIDRYYLYAQAPSTPSQNHWYQPSTTPKPRGED